MNASSWIETVSVRKVVGWGLGLSSLMILFIWSWFVIPTGFILLLFFLMLWKVRIVDESRMFKVTDKELEALIRWESS